MNQPTKPRVLVVDDTFANRMAFTSLLEADYTVRVASDGPEALGMAAAEEFAVILLDVRMPVLDGFETAERLRKQDPAWHTPILFTSAYDQGLEKIKRGYVAGATDFLPSPVNSELLKFKVAAFVRLFLRHEALRVHVEVLHSALQSLQKEMERCCPLEAQAVSHFRDLEGVVQKIHRHVSEPGD